MPASTIDPANTANEIGFNVYRAPIAADGVTVGAYQQVGTAPANVVQFRETAPLGNYMYKVSAHNAHSEVMSAEVRVQAGDFPASPSGLAAVSGSPTEVSLSWTDNAGTESGFRVMRNGVQVADLPADSVGWIDTTVAGATAYSYQVIAYNAVGASAPSNTAFVTTAFAPPTALSATATGARQVLLSWTDNSANETGFVIERALVSGGVAGLFQQVGTAPANPANGATSFTDTSVTDGSAYVYQVRDQNAVGSSAPSNTAAVTTPLAAPTGLTLATSVTPARVTLSWVDNSGAEAAYEVRRDGVLIATLPANSSAYVDSAIVDGASYAYQVSVTNPTGSASSTLQTATLAVAAPTATAVGITGNAPLTATVTWVDNSVSETGYTVQRATNATFTVGLASFAVPAGATSYADSTVLSGRTYYYRVQTVKGAAVSTWAPTVAITVAVPTAPTGLTATLAPVSTNPPTVTLRWTDRATTETGYVVMRATDTAMTQNVVLTPLPANTSSFVDTTVVAGTSYNYRVYATNAVGNSGASARVRVLPGQLWPAATLNAATDTSGAVVAGNGRRTVTVDWTNVVNGNGAPAVTGLAVQRSTTPAFGAPTTTTVPLGTQSFAVANLLRNTTYYFRVRTTNASGQTLSQVLSVTTQP